MSDLSPHIFGLFAAYAAFMLSIVSPGPNFIAILGTSMGVGRASGVALALGVSTGSVVWACLTVLGISALLSTFAGFLTAVKILGGCYLLWLSYKAFRQAGRTQEINPARPDGEQKSSLAYFRQGLTVQLTNPKALLAWIAITSIGLQADAPLWVAPVLVIGTGTISVIVHLCYALAFSSPPALNIYRRARRGIQFVLGSFFAAAGIKLLSSRL